MRDARLAAAALEKHVRRVEVAEEGAVAEAAVSYTHLTLPTILLV